MLPSVAPAAFFEGDKMTERPEMIEGTVCYWNGASGWIRRDDVLDVTTPEQHDVALVVADVASGPIEQQCRVTYEFDNGHARNVKVIGAEAPPYVPPEPPNSPEVPF